MKIKSSTLKRLFSSEIRNLNRVLVVKKKSLKELLQEEEPFVMNKEGKKHIFNKEELEKISQILPQHKHSDPKLPISIYRNMKLEDFYVEGEIEAEVVKKVINYSVKSLNGKLFLPKPLAYKILRKLPTSTQLVWLF